MTFTEIVGQVQARLNLTSPDSATRIGVFVNERYRRITTSIGLVTARRTIGAGVTVANSAYCTISGVNKITSVYDTTTGMRRVLAERTFDEWRNTNTFVPAAGTALTYAVERNHHNSVTIVLDPVPSTVTLLFADGYVSASTLSGSTVPDFPADFHDALVFGAQADELNKMEKAGPAKASEAVYESRVADLRYFLAMSAYLQVAQGGTGGMDRGPYRSGYKWNRWRR